MIKTGITGADTPLAGTLIRILVNHPDVDLCALVADPALKGTGVERKHFGLIGECPLEFTDTFDPDALDFLFITDSGLDLFSLPDDLKWVYMGDNHRQNLGTDTIYGLSEAFRKPLVRGARHAVLPNPVASVALILLNPLALNLLLLGDINVDVTLPEMLRGNGQKLLEEASSEIARILPVLQNSFGAQVKVRCSGASPCGRCMHIGIDLPVGMSAEDVRDLFEGVYDDHNFTYMTSSPLDFADVAGTDKCICRITRSENGLIRLEAVADPTMRGGAAEGVHIMNLLCGLAEKTGLAFMSTASSPMPYECE